MVPRDLVSLSDAALISMFRTVSEWLNYLSIQLACAQVDETAAGREVTRISAIRRYDFRQVAAKETAYNDSEYTSAKTAEDEAHDYRKLIEALHGNLDRDSFSLSRELTRRVGRHDRDSRFERTHG